MIPTRHLEFLRKLFFWVYSSQVVFYWLVKKKLKKDSRVRRLWTTVSWSQDSKMLCYFGFVNLILTLAKKVDSHQLFSLIIMHSYLQVMYVHSYLSNL